MTTRVLLVDDQALLRATFRLLVDSADDLEVVGEASDGAQAATLARSTRADVVLMDIRMPGVDGIEGTRRITEDPALADVKVLVLTTFETDDVVVGALRAGASGFLGKGIDPVDLLAAIRTVAGGDQLLSPVATAALIARIASTTDRGPRDLPGLDELTAREKEIVALVALGLSNQEIGAHLFISPATAKTHVSRALLKTRSRDRAQLVVFAYETGLASPG